MLSSVADIPCLTVYAAMISHNMDILVCFGMVDCIGGNGQTLYFLRNKSSVLLVSTIGDNIN